MKTKILIYFTLLFTLIACAQDKQTQSFNDLTPIQTKDTPNGYKKAYFASGCFWCVESIYESVLGVKQVVSGYSGGTGENPTYQNYIRKGHTETIEVTYNPKTVSYSTLLTVYFGSQNITQQNGQGPDKGSGYRSVIFYQNDMEKELIEKKIEEVQKSHSKPVAAKAEAFQKFWIAEEYHQDFEKRNPDHPYIRNVSLPRLIRFQENHPDLLKEEQ